MKTKIISVSPDQSVIEHESGLKTVFVEGGKCSLCDYSGLSCMGAPCFPSGRLDKKNGIFIKLLEQ